MNKGTKEAILLAAIAEFAQNGYQKATIRRIINRSGAKNLNAVVYYYGGKEELYKAVLNFMFREAVKFKNKEELEHLDTMSIEDKLASIIRFLVRAYYSVDTELDIHVQYLQDQIIYNLENIAFFDIRELYDEDGQLKPLVDLPEHVLQGIADFQTRFHCSGKNDDAGRPIIGISYEVKAHDKLKALKMLSKHLGLFPK